MDEHLARAAQFVFDAGRAARVIADERELSIQTISPDIVAAIAIVAALDRLVDAIGNIESELSQIEVNTRELAELGDRAAEAIELAQKWERTP